MNSHPKPYFYTATTLSNDLMTAWTLYVKKRDYFWKLSEIHYRHVPEWYRMDKSPKLIRGEVTSVYCHSVSKSNSFLETGAVFSLLTPADSYITGSNSSWSPKTYRLTQRAGESPEHILP